MLKKLKKDEKNDPDKAPSSTANIVSLEDVLFSNSWGGSSRNKLGGDASCST